MTKTIEQITKSYKKGNAKYRQSLLRKYGVSSIDKLSTIMDNTTNIKKITKNEMAAIVLNHPLVNMKLSFQKQVKEDDVIGAIESNYWQYRDYFQGFRDALKKNVNLAINGIERIAKISHNNKFDKFGRLYAQDLDQIQKEGQLSNSRMILVSLNHLNWVEINNVKYILK